MPSCPSCSTKVPANAKFCSGCGAKLPVGFAANEPEEVEEFEESSASRGRRRPKKSKSGGGMSAWVIVLLAMAGCSILIIPCLIALLLPAVQQAREAARRTQARNNMKQMGLAMHNFHDTFQQFPPKNIEGDTQPGEQVQSWMTDMLPFMDQGPLYNQIQYSLTWDDPGNQLPMGTVILSYINPSEPTPPIDANGYATAHFAANSYLVSEGKHTSIREITDGTSNTILLGTVNDGFKPWGDPTNHRDPGLGAQGGPLAFGSPHSGIIMVLMADGSVRAISNAIDPEVLHLLGDPADGQAVPNFD